MVGGTAGVGVSYRGNCHDSRRSLIGMSVAVAVLLYEPYFMFLLMIKCHDMIADPLQPSTM